MATDMQRRGWLLQALFAAHYVQGSAITALLAHRRTSPASETKPGKAPKNVDYIGARPKLASSMEAPWFEAACQRLFTHTLSGLSTCSLQHQAHPCTPTVISQAALQPGQPAMSCSPELESACKKLREQQPQGCNTTGSAEDGLTLPVCVQCRKVRQRE